MKNKKGFTLIELLVTIALMLSILGIAIISFINISNRRKEESWQKVKNQTEVAAEEYIKNNEYLISGKDSARISIGRLVSQDYLNVVVNPKTGNAVDMCDFVEIKQNENGLTYSYKYKEYDGGACNADDYLSTSDAGSPKVTAGVSGTKGNGTWYISNTTITAIAKTNGNGPIKEVKYCTSIDGCSTYKNLSLRSDNTYTIINDTSDGDGAGVYAKFVVTNTAGKTSDYTVTYNKDTVKPVCSNDNGSTKWTNTSRTITWECSDKTSGCAENSYTITFKKTTTTGSVEIADKAGNTNSCSANVYVDVDKPTCTVSASGTKGNIVNNIQWYIKNSVTVKATFKDEGSGVAVNGLSSSNKKSTNGKKSDTQEKETSKVTWYGFVKDEAGNEGQCDKTFALEKNVTLTFDYATTNNAKATDSRAKKGKVFNDKYSGIIKYSDSNESGNCQKSKGVGCAVDNGSDKYYYGRSCRNIGDYIRTFTTNSISGASKIQWGGSIGINDALTHSAQYKKQYPTTTFDNTYIVSNLNNEGDITNFTKHEFSYTSPAGNKSNKVILYTEYSVDCDYD